MATVEADTDLYLSMQRPDQSTDDFYKTFTAQGDTINANGGTQGFTTMCTTKTCWPYGTGTLSLPTHLQQ